ncbi:MAG: DUF2007 domain-containing protein [Acidobacteriota bacterium]
MAIIRTFNNEIEAEMAMSALEAAGIESVMLRDDCGGVQPAMGLTAGVRVQIHDDDVEAATEVLDAPTEPVELADGDLES